MVENRFLKHKIALLAIFILGNTVIVFPKGIGIELTVYSLLFCLLPITLICYLYIECAENTIAFNNIVKWLVIIFCIIVFVLCARDYISFVDEVRLPKTPRIVISLVFILASIWLGYSEKKVLYLFSVFSLIIIGIILIIVLVFSSNSINLSALKVQKVDFKILIRQSLTFFIHSFGQLTVPVFLFRDNSPKLDKKVYIYGVALSYILIFIYVINIMLVLGSSAASLVKYPYASLTSIISFGRNFSRLDGFTYFIYFYSSIIKCAVTINVILGFFNNHKKTTAISLAVVLSAICNITLLQELLKSDLFNLLVLIFEIGLPIYILIYQKIKSHQKQ